MRDFSPTLAREHDIRGIVVDRLRYRESGQANRKGP
jgi:hypothetical protein